MRLNRLEISGFKSFPDRSELAFDAGVTAIVGPNGCGKSNVVDAITWVLGEQSAKSLRGDRMEDVIFAGSDARKPTGAAEVKLRLAGVATSLPAGMKASHRDTDDNGRQAAPNGNGHGETARDASTELSGALRSSKGEVPATIAVAVVEFEEREKFVRDVEIGRRLYRSGESEYLIDGEVCRLRDVHDLLMDAGVGVKAYAVIEQGKIGQILSARPTDRRQLIEEAAGVTKYKSRRRMAELKLEAAQQNLTRIEDIIFEVEKQRGALKRQAAKARRYKRLRAELRRWEKVQFAARYRMLAASIESARVKLAAAREREGAAAARLAEVEATLERVRIELAEADTRATHARELAHARELDMGRLQQQAEFDRQQIQALGVAAVELETELRGLDARREPARAELDERRAALAGAEQARDRVTAALSREEAAWEAAHAEIEGLEGDVEAARSEIFSAMNAATALRHAVEHAGAAREKALGELARLDVEQKDLDIEGRRALSGRGEAERALARAQAALEETRVSRVSQEGALASSRVERERLDEACRAREQEIAALAARLASLEEQDAAHADYGEAARLILSPASGVEHAGPVADHLEVERGYERAAEACLGDLLQHVLVKTRADAAAGLRVAADAGRCGFVVMDEAAAVSLALASHPHPAGMAPLSSVVRPLGPHQDAIRAAIGAAWVADSFETAAAAARATPLPIVTRAGEVFRGPHLVSGGARAQARGILATKNEIKDLRDRVAFERVNLTRDHASVDAAAIAIAATEAAIAALVEEQHRQEKAIVEFELRLAQAGDEAVRVGRKQEQVGLERRRADEERQALEAREGEARESIRRLEGDQRAADERFTAAQRRLFAARETMEARARTVAERKAEFAALAERATALAAEVRRIEEASAELESRYAARKEELARNVGRRGELETAIVDARRLLDEAVRAFDTLKQEVVAADGRSAALRAEHDAHDGEIREARRVLEDVRSDVSRLAIARATAESDLTHLASVCLEAVQADLDQVAAEVAQMDERGELGSVKLVEDGDAEDLDGAEGRMPNAEGVAATPEDAVVQLKEKIDRLGPVNMMAIDQFDELEGRHTFLTTQRKDLVDSIAQTTEAIRRIDKTTKERFKDAFEVINQHFQVTFSTLFGGGRATLILLDETDQLESGIDVIAQPPGKRLQSVQLLSGGEKALTAMALMFAIFKYRPSPFCLLDEIDAPLDDANIGRFVEMLQGMQSHTQFILITHNRKTMEIADRLYGVTMEEPGVSKLISLQLN